MKQRLLNWLPKACFLGLGCLFPALLGAQGPPPNPCYCPELEDPWGNFHLGIVYDANGPAGAWNPELNTTPPVRKILTLLCNAAPVGDYRTSVKAIAIPLDGFLGKHYNVEKKIKVTPNYAEIETDVDYCKYRHIQVPYAEPWEVWVPLDVSYDYIWNLPNGNGGGNFTLSHGSLPLSSRYFELEVLGQAGEIEAPSYFDINLNVEDYNSPPRDCADERAGADQGMGIDVTVKAVVYPKIYLPGVLGEDDATGTAVNGYFPGMFVNDWAEIFRVFESGGITSGTQGQYGVHLEGVIGFVNNWVEVQSSIPWQPCGQPVTMSESLTFSSSSTSKGRLGFEFSKLLIASVTTESQRAKEGAITVDGGVSLPAYQHISARLSPHALVKAWSFEGVLTRKKPGLLWDTETTMNFIPDELNPLRVDFLDGRTAVAREFAHCPTASECDE